MHIVIMPVCFWKLCKAFNKGCRAFQRLNYSSIRKCHFLSEKFEEFGTLATRKADMMQRNWFYIDRVVIRKHMLKLADGLMHSWSN